MYAWYRKSSYNGAIPLGAGQFGVWPKTLGTYPTAEAQTFYIWDWHQNSHKYNVLEVHGGIKANWEKWNLTTWKLAHLSNVLSNFTNQSLIYCCKVSLHISIKKTTWIVFAVLLSGIRHQLFKTFLCSNCIQNSEILFGSLLSIPKSSVFSW